MFKSRSLSRAGGVNPDIDTANRLHLSVIAGIGVTNLLFAKWYGVGFTPTMIASLVVLALTAFWTLRVGGNASRVVIPVLGMCMVGIHINAAMGLIEAHFAVFAYMAALIAYRHWIPVVAGATAIALHHVLINELQLMGLPVFCFGAGDRWRVVLHAGYVVAEALVLWRMAEAHSRAHREGAESMALFNHVARDPNNFDLDVQALPVSTDASRAGQESLTALGKALDRVRESLEQISHGTTKLSRGNDDLSARTKQQASSLLEVDHTVSSIASAAQENATSSGSASSHLAELNAGMQASDEMMARLVETTREVSGFADQINDIVGVIDGIAFQTNILALNAAVEAARAGEQGKGFAVVATEVRSLAQRAANAAREVRELITKSGEAVTQSAALADAAGEKIKALVRATESLSAVVAGVRDASSEQSSAVDEILATVSDLGSVVQGNATLAEENAAVTQTLTSDVDQVLDALSRFRTRTPA